jgi:hypothetical protein
MAAVVAGPIAAIVPPMPESRSSSRLMIDKGGAADDQIAGAAFVGRSSFALEDGGAAP